MSAQTSLSLLPLRESCPSPAVRERVARALARVGRGSGFGQHRSNCSENGTEIVEHIRITKPQHCVSQLPQLRIPQRVVSLCVGRVMNIAVKFHDDSSARATEIRDVAPNRFLTFELPAFDRVPSQLEPQLLLSGRRGLPMISSQFRQIRPCQAAIVPTSLSRATGEGQLLRSKSRERVGVRA